MTISDSKLDINDDLSIVSPPEVCAYLSQQTARYEIRIIGQMEADQYEAMLSRGWRRQGVFFFRPRCISCDQCKSLRVDVPSFRPTKSQRRCWNKNRDIRLEIGDLTPSSQSIQLFNAYHADMTQRRGWRENQVDVDEYVIHFLSGDFPFAREFRYYVNDQLIGVGLVDVTANSSSSVYFFHDPAWRPKGPGVFSLLAELQHAATIPLKHHYLGYWIAACPSMAYKNRYQPHQILESYVTDQQLPIWMPGECRFASTSGPRAVG